jgi:hypothetical protein
MCIGTGTYDFRNIAATHLQIFTKCSAMISAFHAICI